MKNKILKALSNNLGFKILAVLLAFVLWLAVYNLEDPTKSKTMTINVNIENKESIEASGKYFQVIDGTNQVSFSVTAAKSILDKLDESDFTATADMDLMSIDADTSIGTVPIEIVCTANVSDNSIKLSATNKTLRVAVDELMSKQFVVSANATGTVADGYALGNVEVTAPNVLKVSGPKSIVQKIASAVATIDVSGMSDTWTTYRATPVLYDEDGNEIDATQLTFNNSTVDVSAEILNTKEVIVSVKSTGTPARGYVVTSITSSPETILLKGSKTVLNGINEIKIPDGMLSVEGATGTVNVEVDVSEYIPDGASLVSNEQSSVIITASIGRIKDKIFSLNTENISVTGLSTNTNLAFELANVAVQISGLEEDINALSAEKISARIDVSYLPIGIHEVELVLDLDETKYTYQTVKVTVMITDATITEDEGGTSEEEPSGQT